MVKGVSKTVIVVNNTGNKYFEKIVFYVSPEYGNTNSGHLNSAATKFISTMDFNTMNKNSLRNRHRNKKRLKIFGITSGVLTLIGATLIWLL
ncbi:MAG: hypothetical protein II234_04420 [Clostridia bacterium]|nr:hypothetical protein [Clostridia bacterium]